MDKFFVKDLLKDSVEGSLLIQSIEVPYVKNAGIGVDVLRLDKIHPVISGNKWFKLKRHLQTALPRKPSALLTFGGAWSNHIVATAFAAQQSGVPSIGIIRGERSQELSATLRSSLGYGMQLEFISRKEYMQKGSQEFVTMLADRFPGAYIIPEGGGGKAGIDGSKEILGIIDNNHYSHIICALGTGSMFLGLRASAMPGQEIIGIPVLKGFTELPAGAGESAQANSRQGAGRLDSRWHWGGYARFSQDLLDFMNRFYRETGIPTDFVYTGKLFYAVQEMVREDLFSAGSHLLVIHSGGLQGNRSLLPGALHF